MRRNRQGFVEPDDDGLIAVRFTLTMLNGKLQFVEIMWNIEAAQVPIIWVTRELETLAKGSSVEGGNH